MLPGARGSRPELDGAADPRASSFAQSGAGASRRRSLFRRALSVARVRWSALAVLLLCGAGTLLYAGVLDRVYPIRQWLFWPLLMLWGWVVLFNAACLSAGQLVLARVLGIGDLPALESAVMSMALGVVAFTLAMYAGGALGLYGTTWALLLPLALIGVGGRAGVRLGRQLLAELGRPVSRGPLSIAIGVFGVFCVGVIYMQLMTPDSLNYDATWYHLTIAQDYARAGRIVAFPGDYNKNFPQLTSLVHTWGWLVPGMNDPLRWMLALHQEFGLFLWTLAGVTVATRVLAAEPHLRHAWVAFFLFPVIFVYDSNIGGAADHVCAFFAVPIVLAALRLRADLSLRNSALFAIVCAGDALTKYQAIFLIAPATAVVAGRWLRELAGHGFPKLARERPVPVRTLVAVPAVVFGLAVLVFMPQAIRNLVFFHNPVYPLLRDVFPSTPNAAHSAFYFDNFSVDPHYIIRGSPWKKLVNAARLFFTFSFEPHYSFTHDVPAVGSLFTLLLPAVVFVPGRSRLLPGALIASGAVVAWGYLYFVDRYLQTFIPVLVCVTAALIVQLWKLGAVARAGLVPLVALQLIWGGDALFYSGSDRIRSSMSLIRSGFDGAAERRFDGYRAPYVALKKALPKNARVILHTQHISLGIDRDILLDWAPMQALISYAHMRTPRELFDRFRSLGVTHLLYEAHMNWAASSKQEEVVWNGLLVGYAEPMGQFGPYRLARMPRQAPPAEAAYRVASFGLFGYADGIYPIDTMDTMEYLDPASLHFRKPEIAMPTDAAERATLIAGTDAVFVEPSSKLDTTTLSVLNRQFKAVLRYKRYTLWLRKARVHHGR